MEEDFLTFRPDTKNMSLFNWLKNNEFGGKAPAAHPYYGARVKVENQTIRFNNDHDEKAQVRFHKISWMALASFSEENPQEDYWLDITPFDGEPRLSIPSKAGGFQQLLAALNELPGFQSEKFNDALHQLSEKRILIYENKTPLSINAKLLPTDANLAFDKLEQGLWLDERRELIPWGSYGDLGKIKGVTKERYQPPNPQYRSTNYHLKKVTILNGLQVDDLKVFGETARRPEKPNPDWPVKRYFSNIVMGSSGKETFSKLCEHIATYWKAPEKQTESLAEWNQGRVTLRFFLNRDSELATYGSECTLNIDYEPDLTPFFTNAYQQSLQIEDVKNVQTFPYNFKISEDYILVSNVFYTPECFKDLFNEKHESLIWVDEKSGKIGFANPNFSRIFPFGKQPALLLEARYWRDELNGYDLYFKNTAKSSWRRMASFGVDADFSETDFMNQLTTLTGMPCERREDRQYY